MWLGAGARWRRPGQPAGPRRPPSPRPRRSRTPARATAATSRTATSSRRRRRPRCLRRRRPALGARRRTSCGCRSAWAQEPLSECTGGVSPRRRDAPAGGSQRPRGRPRRPVPPSRVPCAPRFGQPPVGYSSALTMDSHTTTSGTTAARQAATPARGVASLLGQLRAGPAAPRRQLLRDRRRRRRRPRPRPLDGHLRHDHLARPARLTGQAAHPASGAGPDPAGDPRRHRPRAGRQ